MQFQKYYYIQAMASKLVLNDVVNKIYGSSLQIMINPQAEWQVFTPYSIKQSGETLLLKLIEVPAEFQTSQEIHKRISQRFKHILHPISIIQAQRNLKTTYYLLSSKTNLISVEAYIKLKLQAKEFVQENILIKFLEFASVLQSHQYANQITFGLDQIGMDSKGNFMLANYEMYFYPQQKTLYSDLNMDIRRTLSKLLYPQEKLDLGLLYDHVSKVYGPNMLSVIERCMSGSFRASEAATMITLDRSNFLETTLSDSHNSAYMTIQELQNAVENVSFQSNGLTEQLLPTTKVKSKRSYKPLIFFIVFITMLAVIGAVTFKYLNPRPLVCNDSQYLNKQLNQCLSCNSICDRCEGGSDAMCISCRENMFLNKKTKNQKSGTCSLNCAGILIAQKICIEQ